MKKIVGLLWLGLFLVGDQLIKIIVLWQYRQLIFANPGYAFGWEDSSIWMLVAIIGLVFLLILAWKNGFFFRWPVIFILAGVLSNFIDRVRLGYVVDYWHFGTDSFLNLADILIILGILGYGYIIFRDVKR